MNGGMKAALTNSKLNCCIYVRTALFHSTPALDRKRRSYWEPRSNHYSGRTRRNQAKQTLLRNANAYADLLFQTLRNESFEDEPSSSKGTSWFKKQYSAKGSKKNWAGNQGGWNSGRRSFKFCCEDEDIETIFQSMFGGNKFYSWSFINEDYSRGSSSNYSNHGRSSNWRRRYEEEYQSESESESTESGERLALGLSASGPLTLEDVKNAYRASALKYHPDRHQGSSKTAAEEKFKLCSAAYRSLCDKFGVNGPCSKPAKAQRC